MKRECSEHWTFSQYASILKQMRSPSTAEAPRFDVARNAWMLSRYADIYAALREPALVQASAQNKTTDVNPSEIHAKIQADIARLSAVELRARMEREASKLITRVSHGRPIDLVKELIHPWCVAMMLALNGNPPESAKRLAEPAARLFFFRNSNQPLRNKWAAWRRRNASAELDRMLEQQKLVLSMPMFSGVTQTLPSFLARAWLALLEHPNQKDLLTAEPALMPGAMEELLRYAGIVHTLYRQATSDVCIGEARIARGQAVILKMDSANFDSAKFDEPHRLDIRRQPSGHLGLGAGPYACAGAVLVRSAFTLITPFFLVAGPALEAGRSTVWTSDTSIRWPQVIFARLQGD